MQLRKLTDFQQRVLAVHLHIEARTETEKDSFPDMVSDMNMFACIIRQVLLASLFGHSQLLHSLMHGNSNAILDLRDDEELSEVDSMLKEIMDFSDGDTFDMKEILKAAGFNPENPTEMNP